ncbi:MAG: Flp pilus assembly protein CpaB [Proteobacteria bacterium]|nr:Flp pilus assembly protein CpaB [Pseudomonadota bacterium]
MAVGLGSRIGGAGTLSAHKKQRKLMFLGMGILGFSSLLIVTILANQYVSANQKETPTPIVAKESSNMVILAANTKIARGTKITAEMLSEVKWPKEQLPEGTIKRFDDVVNQYAVNTIIENQPVVKSLISASAPNLSVSDLLTPGTRAVTIKVDATSGIEGWATPGTHVDVLLTYLDTSDGKNKTIVAVENAVVLSYDGLTKDDDSKEGNRDKNTINNTTATLGVPVADSLKIQTALSMGRITLAMRSSNDVTTPSIKEFSQDQWTQKVVAPAPVPVQNIKRASLGKGYAKFSTPDGVQKQYTLSDEDRWQHESSGDDSY